jgi:RNA polymerase-binding transcription factor DksA
MGIRYVHCRECGSEIEPPQRGLLTSLCVLCGEEHARQERASWCVVPLHKSNYMKVNLKSDLRGINNKGGLVK